MNEDNFERKREWITLKTQITKINAMRTVNPFEDHKETHLNLPHSKYKSTEITSVYGRDSPWTLFIHFKPWFPFTQRAKNKRILGIIKCQWKQIPSSVHLSCLQMKIKGRFWNGRPNNLSFSLNKNKMNQQQSIQKKRKIKEKSFVNTIKMERKWLVGWFWDSIQLI